MPGDEYFEHTEKNVPVSNRPEFQAPANNLSMEDFYYESLCITFARIMSRYMTFNLSDNALGDMLVSMLPWPISMPEKQVRAVVDEAISDILYTPWELGEMIIEQYFLPSS